MNKFFLFLVGLVLSSCQKTNLSFEKPTACSSIYENYTQHPKHMRYQALLDQYQERGLVGVTMLTSDKEGLWIGASGMANLATQRAMQACDRMPIASISKVFTAVVIFKLVEKIY